MNYKGVHFYLAATIALTFSVAAQDLLTVLRDDPNTVAFANLLDQHPDMLAALDPSKQYTVFAPSNDAVAAFLGSSTSNGTLTSRGLSRRSLSDIQAAIALHFTNNAGQELLNVDPTDLVTNLTDPAFVNIGPSVPVSNTVVSSTSSSQSPSSSTISTNTVLQSSSVASSTTISSLSIQTPASSTLTSAPSKSSTTQPSSASAQSTLSPPSTSQPTRPSPSQPSEGAHLPACNTPPPPPTGPPTTRKRSLLGRSSVNIRQVSQPNITIYSGFGNKALSSKCETKYSSGVVRTVDSFFTLFGDLPTTLQQKSGTAFASSLQKAGLLDSWSNTPKITVFVPTDSVLQNQTLDADTLKQYILFDTLATTTGLSAASSFNSSAGISINVTANSDGSFIVNDAYISGANTMIKNGVIHFIDNVFKPITPAPVVVSSATVAKLPISQATAVCLVIILSYLGVSSF